MLKAVLRTRHIFSFLVLIVLCSCKQENERSITYQNTFPNDSSNILSGLVREDNVGNKTTIDTALTDWEKQQDSLRNEILKEKKNEILKESFLQEMYIRNVVSLSDDTLAVKIPFNLHGPDCVARDCYTTDVSFSFKLEDQVIFPRNIPFKEHEYGCIGEEQKLSGIFQLVEETSKHVIYYAEAHKRTLVLFDSNKENGTTAFYFTGLEQNSINGENIYSLMEDYDEDDRSSIYPFTSWELTTNEYANFLP